MSIDICVNKPRIDLYVEIIDSKLYFRNCHIDGENVLTFNGISNYNGSNAYLNLVLDPRTPMQRIHEIVHITILSIDSNGLVYKEDNIYPSYYKKMYNELLDKYKQDTGKVPVLNKYNIIYYDQALIDANSEYFCK